MSLSEEELQRREERIINEVVRLNRIWSLMPIPQLQKTLLWLDIECDEKDAEFALMVNKKPLGDVKPSKVELSNNAVWFTYIATYPDASFTGNVVIDRGMLMVIGDEYLMGTEVRNKLLTFI